MGFLSRREAPRYTWLMRAASPAPIPAFHALEDAADPFCFPPEPFHRGLDRLAGSEFRAFPLEQLAACASGDGGCQSVDQEAFPALQEHRVHATVFLAAAPPSPFDSATRLPTLGGRTMLDWSRIREMYRAGVSFGARTLTHSDLTRLSPAGAEAGIRDSQAMLEDAPGTRVRTFAHPCGRFHSQSREIVRRRFDLACPDRLGLAPAACDVRALCRVAARAVPRRLRRAPAARLER